MKHRPLQLGAPTARRGPEDLPELVWKVGGMLKPLTPPTKLLPPQDQPPNLEEAPDPEEVAQTGCQCLSEPSSKCRFFSLQAQNGFKASERSVPCSAQWPYSTSHFFKKSNLEN